MICHNRLPKVRKNAMILAPSTIAFMRLTARVLSQTINATASAVSRPPRRGEKLTDISRNVCWITEPLAEI
ncbi:hypothetical protein D3C73_1653610 [compost metagenome]